MLWERSKPHHSPLSKADHGTLTIRPLRAYTELLVGRSFGIPLPGDLRALGPLDQEEYGRHLGKSDVEQSN